MAKTLIAYFSHAGQNYSHGGIKNLYTLPKEWPRRKSTAKNEGSGHPPEILCESGGDLTRVETPLPSSNWINLPVTSSCVSV